MQGHTKYRFGIIYTDYAKIAFPVICANSHNKEEYTLQLSE